MARSTAVWVVLSDDPDPLATFTVKHEMKSWLEREHSGDLERLKILKMPDGLWRSDPVVRYDPMTLQPLREDGNHD